MRNRSADTLFSSTCGLVAMTSASHAEGRQFDPGQVYSYLGKQTEARNQAIGASLGPSCELWLGRYQSRFPERDG